MAEIPEHSVPETLYVALGDEPDAGFDPIYGWGKYGNPLFQSTLLKRDQSLQLVSELATKWELSTDRLSWNMTLRSNVLFSDGEPLTAQDVAFTFNQAKQSASIHDLTDLKSVDVINDTQVRFNLQQPNITFIDHFVSLGIVPKHAYQRGYGQHPIGSGPYMFKRWDKGQQLILTINPFFYGKKPVFNNIVAIFGNEDSRYTLLRAGQVQLTTIPQRYTQQLPNGYQLWQVPTVDNRGIVWPMNTETETQLGNNISASPAIRTAFDYAIDRPMLVDNLLDGFAKPAYSIADGMPWGPNLTTTHFVTQANIAKAKAILDKAGWKDTNNDGLRDKNGQEAKLTLFYSANDSVRQQLALTVSQMVKPLGIEVTTQGADWSVIARNMTQNPVLMGFGSHSANEIRYVYHSDFAGIDFYNSGQYRNQAVDNVIKNAMQASSWSASILFWQQAQHNIAQDRPWTWLVNIDHLYAASQCLDLGQPITEPHGHGWPLTANIEQWRWTCQ